MKKTVPLLLALAFIVSQNIFAFALTDAELYPYVWQVPTVSSPGDTHPAVLKIRSQVNRIIAENRHDLIGARIWGTNNQILWGHGRAVAAIAQTIPFLDATQAAGVRTFLSYEVDNFLLNNTALDQEVSGSLGTMSGADFGLTWRNNTAFRWEALYGLWAYAHYTGDWTKITSNWNAIKTVYSNCPSNSQRLAGSPQGWDSATVSGINSEIAGLIGYARMARKTGDTTAANAAASAAFSRFNTVLSTVAAAPQNPVQVIGVGALGRFLSITYYYDLTPELGRFLADKAQSAVSTHVNFLTNRFRTWFLADNDFVSDWMSVAPFPPTADPDERPGEEGYQMSLIASPIYLLKAYATNAPLNELAAQLPLGQSSVTTPHYLDMQRLQNLAAWARRAGTVTWAEQ